VSEPVVENGQTDSRIGGFRHRWATIFTTPMAISRCREVSRQRPTTGTKADGSQPNDESSRATIFTGRDRGAGTAEDVGAIRISPARSGDEGHDSPVRTGCEHSPPAHWRRFRRDCGVPQSSKLSLMQPSARSQRLKTNHNPTPKRVF